jgi:tRNA U34 5-methylaminomethyl-2-thiouridine-forming methyltransferase MnmC
MIPADERKLLLTGDGSYTVELPSMGVTYHSTRGAVQESMHVFIKEGLQYLLTVSKKRSFEIFEMGFGTGLNPLLTCIEARKAAVRIHYTAIDLYPLPESILNALAYQEQIHEKDARTIFEHIHNTAWGNDVHIHPDFILRKEQKNLLSFMPERMFDLVYFDAFGPASQPELWTVSVFKKIYEMMHQTAVLVTYSSKGDVRRALKAAGFKVEKIPGPPGKREMVRAIKNSMGQARL